MKWRSWTFGDWLCVMLALPLVPVAVVLFAPFAIAGALLHGFHLLCGGDFFRQRGTY